MQRIEIRSLTAAAFAPFGIVVQALAGGGRPINEGTTERFDLAPDLQLNADGGHAMLALFRAQARRFPHTVLELERHALGTQTFVPLGVHRFVIVVARAGAAPRADELVAFVTDGRQGIVLAPGTWHHALLAVEGGDFAVVERSAAEVDCEACEIAPAVVVEAPG